MEAMRGLTDLRRRFAGELLEPGDRGYDDARTVFNAMIDRRPAVIARCTGVADVRAAVNFARRHGLLTAVRCGGHSVIGLSVCDGGMVIDLSAMRSIEVDAAARTARADGGVLWGELDAATQAHGLHTPGGRIASTGIGGFTTGGGYGWTSSVHGLACDNLRSVEMVLADGEVVTASEAEHPDLFWAMRGGGCNFGIVTSFEFELHPLGPLVQAGVALWPVDQARRVITAYREWMTESPDELTTTVEILTARDEPAIPEQLRGRPCVGITAMWIGDLEEGARRMGPLRALEPDLDLIAPTPYVEFQRLLDPANPPGYRNYWAVEYLPHLPDAAIDEFIGRAKQPLSPTDQLVLIPLGQRGLTRLGDDDTAISHREARWMFHPIMMWRDPADDARMMGYAREFCAAMRPFATGGSYLGFTSERDRVRAAYGERTYARLAAVKERYDPGNLFRHNHNVVPRAATMAAS